MKLPSKIVAVSVLIFAALTGGCVVNGETGAETVALWPDAEIAAQAEAVIAGFVSSLNLNDREVIFSAVSSVSQGVVTLAGETSDVSLKAALLDTIATIPAASVKDAMDVLPLSSMGNMVYGIVNVPVLDLGDRPNSPGDSHRVTQARMGDVLRLLKHEDGWYLAQMEDRYLGWVGPESIFLCDQASVDAFRTGRTALILSKSVPILDGPGGEPLFSRDLVQGSVVPALTPDGEWTRVLIPGGSEGWIEASGVQEYPGVVEAFSERKGAEAVICTAKQYVGLPYLWGGTTSYGFDCSGLTQFAMKMNGYSLRRDSDMQYEQGQPVETRGDLMPGDLVFFETYQKGPSHVGLYIGDCHYIQSGGNTGLTIQSFNPADPDYSFSLDQAYFGARRVIK